MKKSNFDFSFWIQLRFRYFLPYLVWKIQCFSSLLNSKKEEIIKKKRDLIIF